MCLMELLQHKVRLEMLELIVLLLGVMDLLRQQLSAHIVVAQDGSQKVAQVLSQYQAGTPLIHLGVGRVATKDVWSTGIGIALFAGLVLLILGVLTVARRR